MGLSRSIGIALLTAALATGSGAGWAGDPPKASAEAPVDLGLLEFLGNVPSADAAQPADRSWLAYLSQINIGKVAKVSQPPSQAAAQPKPASSAAGAGKPNG